MLDGSHHQIFLRLEVIGLRATSDACHFSDPRCGGSRVAVCHQAFDCGIEQTRAHLGTALRLSAARCPPLKVRYHHRPASQGNHLSVLSSIHADLHLP
ncbi:Uncharacterised protein [Mycobacteroides abscessus subsp. abscessus]|nr:Uncharacterised protein [Mycobacteroides abscessus subsp. abscessus]